MIDITQKALSLGFSLVGVAPVKSMAQTYTPIFEYRLQSDYDDQIDYMRRNLDKRLDPAKLFEGARSVVVCALSATNLSFNNQNRARIASYALCRDYHLVIKELLAELAAYIVEAYPQARTRCFVDTAPLLEKAWAVEAGLGYIGRNSLLISREYGSQLFLGEIVTDVDLGRSTNGSAPLSCGNCTACIDNCPTGAIKENGSIDTRLCISRNTIERRDEPTKPEELHGWIFGCEVCQQVCPHNHSVISPRHSLLIPKVEKMTTSEWENMSEEEFDALFSDTPLKRSGLSRIKSNIG